MDTDSDSSLTQSSRYALGKQRNTHWPDVRRTGLLSKIEDRFESLYYRLGLLCSSHPWIILIFSLLIFAVAAYPLLHVHFIHSSSSQQYVTKLDGQTGVDESKNEPAPPRWLQTSKSYAYIQQIVVKAAVVPWQSNLILMDAIRAPLGQVFALQEFISNHQVDFGDSKTHTFGDSCFQVGEPVATLLQQQSSTSTSYDSTATLSGGYLPRYSCLQLSPANIWRNDINAFLQDATLIKTLYGVKDLASPDSSGSVREILFGVPWMETGIRKLYLRTRQRTITYAVTLVMKQYDREFISSLTAALRERYPTIPYKIAAENDSESTDNVTRTSKKVNGEQMSDETHSVKNITHLYYREEAFYSDLIPLLCTYVALFFYVYFFVRKIDIIKNKWALAIGSVATVVLSLLMSIGICFWFDFNPTLNRTGILPYLVLIVGLENIIVLTKSVVSTGAHLDRRVRVAQGLSKEGFNISKVLSIWCRWFNVRSFFATHIFYHDIGN